MGGIPRKIITVVLDRWSIENFHGPVDELIVSLSSIRHKYQRKGCSVLRFVCDWGHNDFEGYKLIGDREETEEEAALRVEDEEAERAIQLRKECEDVEARKAAELARDNNKKKLLVQVNHATDEDITRCIHLFGSID